MNGGSENWKYIRSTALCVCSLYDMNFLSHTFFVGKLMQQCHEVIWRMLPKSTFVSKCVCRNACLLPHSPRIFTMIRTVLLLLNVCTCVLHPCINVLKLWADWKMRVRAAIYLLRWSKWREFWWYFIMQMHIFQVDIYCQMLCIHSVPKINHKFRENICTFHMFLLLYYLTTCLLKPQLCFNDEALASTE